MAANAVAGFPKVLAADDGRCDGLGVGALKGILRSLSKINAIKMRTKKSDPP
jgi:hypothetical protein